MAVVLTHRGSEGLLKLWWCWWYWCPNYINSTQTDMHVRTNEILLFCFSR